MWQHKASFRSVQRIRPALITSLAETDPSCHPPRAPASSRHSLSRSSGDAPRTLGDTRLETVLELPRDLAEVSHAAGTGDLSPLSLLGPVVCICPMSAILFGVLFVSSSASNVHLRILAAG
jgi:hypothetical protein